MYVQSDGALMAAKMLWRTRGMTPREEGWGAAPALYSVPGGGVRRVGRG